MKTEITTDGDTSLSYEELRVAASNSYNDMKRSWFSFARAISVIHETEAWRDYGHDNFKAFIVDEYRDINYKTVIKFIKIIESYGKEIEKKLAKDPDADIASYESFYALTTAAKKGLSKTDITRLKKQLVDAKLTYKNITAEINSKIRDTTKEITEEKEEERTVFEDVAEEAIPLGATPEEVAATEKAVEETEDVDGLVELGGVALRTLSTTLAKIKKAKIESLENNVIDFGNELEELIDDISSFLNDLEKL